MEERGRERARYGEFMKDDRPNGIESSRQAGVVRFPRDDNSFNHIVKNHLFIRAGKFIFSVWDKTFIKRSIKARKGRGEGGRDARGKKRPGINVGVKRCIPRSYIAASQLGTT